MMTMTQKILAKHAGMEQVKPGQLIEADLDLVMSSDATFPISLRYFRAAGFHTVFDPEKIALVMDHFTPNKDIKAAENCRLCREFAKEQCIEHFYARAGRCGNSADVLHHRRETDEAADHGTGRKGRVSESRDVLRGAAV